MGLFQGSFVFGQERLTVRKDVIPTGSTEELQKIQKNAEMQMSMQLAEIKVVRDPQMQNELQRIVDLMSKISPAEFFWTPYKVIVINDTNFGAAAYQNGKIVIDQNLVCRQSDPMVMYVLGHEIAHIGLKHGLAENLLKGQLQYGLTEFLKTQPKPGDVITVTKNIQTRLDELYFQQEVMADIWGVRLMVASGFRIPDGGEMSDYFIDYKYYPEKAVRTKMVLDEQNSFLNLCSSCSQTPLLNLSKLRLGCYRSPKSK